MTKLDELAMKYYDDTGNTDPIDFYKAAYEQAIKDVLSAIKDAVNYCDCTREIQNLIKEEK